MAKRILKSGHYGGRFFMAGILWLAHGKVGGAVDRQVERVVWKKACCADTEPVWI
ncbi:MAG: hypothetical protein ACRCX9_10395 [Plesiomonas shigelloides]